MRDHPRISVITPVFNGEDYIRETINSVLSHSKDYPVEYLVIDDGSTDSTSGVLLDFSSSIKVITQLNGGESKAVNEGIKNSVGDFVLIVSADDPLFTSEIFEGVLEFFDANPDVVVWYPNWSMIDKAGKVILRVNVEEYSEDSLIGRFKCLPGPGAFIRKSAALKIGGRRERWKFVGDYDFWLRISRIGQLKKRDAVLAQWRLHEDSTSVSQRGEEMFQERIAVIEEFVSEFSIPNPLARKARAHAYYFASLLCYHSKEVNGRKALIKAFWVGRGRVEDSQLRVVLYILFMPLSFYLKPLLENFASKAIRARK